MSGGITSYGGSALRVGFLAPGGTVSVGAPLPADGPAPAGGNGNEAGVPSAGTAGTPTGTDAPSTGAHVPPGVRQAPAPVPSPSSLRTGSGRSLVPPAGLSRDTAAGGGGRPARRVPPSLAVTADHTYAARLTAASVAAGTDDGSGPAWFAERWTLDGPEPYAVSLPLDRPEEAASDVLPLSDGRVLIRRRVAGRHTFSLLYPTGPGTGELPLGDLVCAELVLLPPPPDGMSAYALVPGEHTSSVWLVAGGRYGPEHVADVPGRCSGGAWLDRAGRLLALDRRLPGGGPVKAVAVDLGRGEVTPLLQITPDSDDRLLLADPDSGLLLIGSDAPGEDRLGWGVLGSCLPVRFPECLRVPGVTLTPFAVQPGQALMPEGCAVALRVDGASDSWVGIWRPAGRRLHHVAPPAGWLTGSGFWSGEGVLHLPYADGDTPCAVALLPAPADAPYRALTDDPCGAPADAPCRAAAGGTEPSAADSTPPARRPVPLGEAPLTEGSGPG
ncbi:hypothetical protein [Streptomyces nitrosporeus]|uniref:hypothetical protein n=1 Tax=Streptomyces nitrosporeus TaxID=28894 RepID=UPI003570DF2B